MSPTKDRLRTLLTRLDPWLVGLAILSVSLHLVTLLWGEHPLLLLLIRVADGVFVLDLVLKLLVMGHSYRTGPWVVVDVLSCLPVLDSLPGVGPALRLMRVLRALRLMRLMRLVRTLQVFAQGAEDLELPPPARLGFSALVLLYAALTVVLDTLLVQGAAPEQARVAEAGLLLGISLGVLITVSVVRLLLPAVSDQQLRELFRVTLPHQLAERLLADPGAYHRTESAHATVIFCDISGFTRSVEALGGDLDAVKRHLERVMDVVTDIHRRHDLIVDKFIGDAVMAFRGGGLVPGTPAEHARRVVLATLEAVQAVEALADPHFPRIKIGGASTDSALIGAFGTSRRLSYTILGDRVNLAARLEAAIKFTGTANLFCEQTHTLLAQEPDLRWRRFGSLQVPGKREPQPAYEAFSAQDGADWRWLDRFHVGLSHYEALRLSEAVAAFSEADQLRPQGDPPARRWVAHCQALLSEPTPLPAAPAFVVEK